VVVICQAKIDAAVSRCRHDVARPTGDVRLDGVEEVLGGQLDAALAKAFGQRGGAFVHTGGDRAQAGGAVVDRVHAGDDREQDLRGADVAGRLLAADVLLAGLQREPVRGLARRVDRDADEPAGQAALESLAYGHVPGVRTAVHQWNAEPLRAADRDVRAELARRTDEREREQVGGDRDLGAAVVRLLNERGVVAECAAGAGVLDEHAEELALGQAGAEVGDLDVDAEGFGAGLDDRDRLRQRVGVDDEPVALAGLVRPPDQRHRLGGGGALVEQGGTGDVEAGEVGEHGLEVDQRLEPALADLRLVRRVGGVPGRALQHVPLDHRGGVGVVVAEADHGREPDVVVGVRTQLGQRLGLGRGRGEVERAVRADGLGDRRVDELVE
jgi:hypothetical protein